MHAFCVRHNEVPNCAVFILYDVMNLKFLLRISVLQAVPKGIFLAQKQHTNNSIKSVKDMLRKTQPITSSKECPALLLPKPATCFQKMTESQHLLEATSFLPNPGAFGTRRKNEKRSYKRNYT